VASPSTETDALKAEVAELKDRLLRAHAEMDNMRKRLEKEKSEASKYAIARFARDIVGVGDNFQRAIDTVPEAAAEATPALKSFLDGVTMTERELINVLERHGIKRIDPKGQPFNPHHHQAVMEQPNPEVPSGTITQVFQPGYLIEDRILRPAMVVVAKGGFKPVKAPDAPSAPAANDDIPSDGSGAGGPHDAGGTSS
jgi:molecular chaperone GrpE